MKKTLQFYFHNPVFLKSVFSIYAAFFLFCLLPQTLVSQQTYTFTVCGATGSVGPTQTMANNTYSSTNLNGSVTIIGSGIQQWTVPVTGMYRVQAWGASGGDATSYTTTPGNGASMQGDVSLTAGDVVRILVGQMGQDRQFSAGGGGATYVTKTPHNTLASILVVAGGGGAASQDFSGLSAVTATCGTFDVQSGPATCNGDGGISFTGNSGSGGGGFFTSGQAGGIGTGGASYTLGGVGGATNNQQAGGFGGGGGQNGTGTYAACGGGGFSGGNGGNRNSTQGTGRMGGGGGGSYNNGTNQLNAVLTTTGHGRVVITELCSISIFNSSTTLTPNPAICSGNTLTLTTNAISNYSWSNGSNASSVIVSPTVTTVYSLSATSPSMCTTVSQITVFVSQGLPTVAINQTTNNICLGQSVTFTASGANSYTWLAGAWGGSVINGQAFTPTISSNYTVTGVNACGATTSTAQVTVAPLSVSASSSSSFVCAGSTLALSVVAAATSFTWLPGNLITSTPSLVVSPLSNTAYTITASDGTCSGVANVTITANPVPTITAISTNSMICPGESVTLTATGGANYTWSPGGTVAPSIVVTPSVPILYSVIGDNSFGCTGNSSTPIIVGTAPVLTVSSTAPLICAGESVTLSVGATNGPSTYSWSNSSMNTTVVVNPSQSTVYSVTGTLTSSGCATTSTINVDVFDPMMSISGGGSVCSGQSVTLTATAPSAIGYTWQPNNFPFQTLVVSPTVNSTYTASSVSNSLNVSCPVSGTVSVSINPNPTITTTADRTVMCKGESNTLTASGANTYTWTGQQTGASIVITSNLVTSLVYTVTGTSANGCTDEGSITILVNGCVGLKEQENKKYLKVYPNPASGAFTLESETEINILIINQLGQVIRSVSLNQDNENRVNIADLEKGIYLIRESGSTRSHFIKVIVE